MMKISPEQLVILMLVGIKQDYLTKCIQQSAIGIHQSLPESDTLRYIIGPKQFTYLSPNCDK